MTTATQKLCAYIAEHDGEEIHSSRRSISRHQADPKVKRRTPSRDDAHPTPSRKLSVAEQFRRHLGTESHPFPGYSHMDASTGEYSSQEFTQIQRAPFSKHSEAKNTKRHPLDERERRNFEILQRARDLRDRVVNFRQSGEPTLEKSKTVRPDPNSKDLRFADASFTTKTLDESGNAPAENEKKNVDNISNGDRLCLQFTMQEPVTESASLRSKTRTRRSGLESSENKARRPYTLLFYVSNLSSLRVP